MMWANFLLTVARILNFFVNAYVFVVIVRVILSWIHVPSLYQLNVVLYRLTEPLLKPIRKFVPPYKMGGLDLSPMILIVLLLFINSFLIKSLTQYALMLQRGAPWNL
jgi:YggT family protein